MVLLAVMRLRDEAYGISVQREIEQTAGRALSIGAIYATLVRLESKGLMASTAGEPTAERGGRAKRYYRVTAQGKRSLRSTHDAISRMSAGLKDVQTG
jgi:DNA-binding PadR family transcriptional regulator